jgi:hypothetical protein
LSARRARGGDHGLVRATVSFDYVEHLVRVPVQLGDQSHGFLVDTGIGITVISSTLASRSDVEYTGETFTARRMSGQQVETPLVRLPQLRLGRFIVSGHVAGVADLGPAAGPNGFAGILGPAFFDGHVVTTDPASLILSVEPRADFKAVGWTIPLEVRRDGPSLDLFTTLVLPNGREICVEVDTGSGTLILDSRFMPDCGVSAEQPGVITRTGTDETGYQWTRLWATLSGGVHLAAAPETVQTEVRVQFQDIIHDGLIGTHYLTRYRTSLDVTGGRLILAPRTPLAD